MRRACAAAAGAVLVCMSAAVGALQQSVFRAAAQGVSVDVSVRAGNRPVLDLRASDFLVYDDDVRQTIDSVSIGAVPIDATIFLGTNNASAAAQLGKLNADIKKIVALLQPDDRFRLLTLGNEVNEAVPWHNAGEPSPGVDIQVGGVQSLYDACFLAMMHRPDSGRRDLVVAITDGVEFGSVVDSAVISEVARRTEGVLHLVLVEPATVAGPEAPLPAPPNQTFPRGTIPSAVPATPYVTSEFMFLRASWFHVFPDEHGLDRLQEAARTTGGTVRRTNAGEPVVESFKRVLSDFRQSYLLRYTASGVPAGGWHALRVDVAGNKNYAVRARKGYFGG